MMVMMMVVMLTTIAMATTTMTMMMMRMRRGRLSHVVLVAFTSLGVLMEFTWSVLELSWAHMGQSSGLSWGPLGPF